VLADELAALGVRALKVAAAGVYFEATLPEAWAVNLQTRLASRVLMRLTRGGYRTEDDIYRLAHSVAWEQWFDPTMTLRVDVTSQRSPLTSLNFVTLRVKDAIVDRLRELTGRRPSIDTRAPDVRVQVFLSAQEATVYLDLSGESLFKRGWRGGEDDKGEAPLKENLAAGLIALAGWRPEMAFYDPFCGSGTLLIEAAQWALDQAPGSARSFGFERLKVFDAVAWADLRRIAAQRTRARLDQMKRGELQLHMAGSDIDPRAVRRAERNMTQAGLPPGLIRLGVTDLAAENYLPPWKSLPDGPAANGVRPRGMIVSNPPYGERVTATVRPAHPGRADRGERNRRFGRSDVAEQGAGSSLVSSEDKHTSSRHAAHAGVMGRCGDTLKRHFSGWQLHLISADPELPLQLGMQANRRAQLFNGALECRMYGFDLFARARP
jgi:putative N6-adenine-specific DNA methylase